MQRSLATTTFVLALSAAALCAYRDPARLPTVDLFAADLAVPNAETAGRSSFHFPADIRALDGRRVRIRGEMYPPDKECGLNAFVLIPESQRGEFIFSHAPPLHLCIPVFLPVGHECDYRRRPFEIKATFRLQPAWWQGKLQNLYELHDAIVSPSSYHPGYRSAMMLGGC